MKNKTIYPLLFLLILGLFTTCDSNEQERLQAIEARQDSLEQLRQRQQRRDSIAAASIDNEPEARVDRVAETTAVNKKGEPIFQGDFGENGHFSVQVAAWRSKVKGQQLVTTWQSRGFKNAHMVKYGNAETGNVWFRVRLGSNLTQKQAQKVQRWLAQNYQIESWVVDVG